jgi:hypothetical protein
LGSNIQARAQDAVYDLLKGLAGLARFGPKLRRHIIVEG